MPRLARLPAPAPTRDDALAEILRRLETIEAIQGRILTGGELGLDALHAKVDRLFVAIEDIDLKTEPGDQEDPRHVELFASLWAIVGDEPDLSFDSEEVVRHSKSDHRLSEALHALRATDTTGVGVVFRLLRNRPIGRLTLRRDRRGWRLECTSCT